jgi:uncharacterized glyoxalase superfamily protein PhnB
MALALPDGYHNVNAYLVVDEPEDVIAFVTRVLDGRCVERMEFDGRTMHAEVRVGDAIVMIGRASGRPPMPAMLYVYVEDCDAAYARALEAGAESLMEPADMYYGDRHGGVRDVSGNAWFIATHLEDVPPEELARRHEAEQLRRRSVAAQAAT